VARLDKEIADVAREFVLVRVTSMRGVNLSLFDFDYDLTWMGFFLSPEKKVLGRYGSRDAESADARVSLAGLRRALSAALEQHRADEKRLDGARSGDRAPTPGSGDRAPTPSLQPVGTRTTVVARSPDRATAQTVEDFPAVKRLPARACVHCHQVYEFRREYLQSTGAWGKDELWVYPLPENVGLTLDVDRGNVVTRVAAGSPADRLGIRKDDEIVRVRDSPVASLADFQWGLHRGPKKGNLEITWRRDGQEKRGELELPEGWRETDLSWRWSLRSLDPPPWVQGMDLSVKERKELGLTEKQLALRQGPFLTPPAEQAGIRHNDVIVAIDGKSPELTARQFAAYVRLNYKVGDRVTYTVLREGKRIEIPLRLQGRQ
jgi:hypothetical protein